MSVTKSILLVLSIISIYFSRLVILISLMPLVSMMLVIYFSVNALMGGILESVRSSYHMRPRDQESSESSSGWSW